MINLSVDQETVLGVAEALRWEEDGAKLRRDLSREIRQALEPAASDARVEILEMASAGFSRGESLRTAVAKQVVTEGRLTGRHAGGRVRVRNRGMPRGFDNAPRRLNARKGWRHPVPRRRRRDGSLPDEKWVQQIGKPGWFDDTLRSRAREYREAVMAAVEEMRERIRRRAR